jgi:hypothetical protein
MKRSITIRGLSLLLLCWGTALGAFAQGNSAMATRMYALPAPAGLAIDGDLARWDTSGGIDVFATQETRAQRHARFYLLYDTEALYLGADVTDATPMMNVHDPVTDAARGWNGDALQVRLYLTPTFPGTASSFDTKTDPTPQLCHLLCWYYGAGKTPVLQLAYGMKYLNLHPDWRDGIVPNARYQAAYRLRSDKSGYRLTYRIPWTVLSDTYALKAGDLTAATCQIHWAIPDGSAIEPGGVANGLQSRAGFAFQETGCWGKLIFSPTGNLVTQAAGEKPKLPTPLTFSYTAPKAGTVTVALVDDRGAPVRHLVAAQPRTAGPVIERWDGLGDNGAPLPAGTYRWKGLVHDPLQVTHRLSVHNAGNPPYPTADGTGSWGADHNPPSAVACAGNRMLLGWEGCEAGWGFIGTDLSGHKQWGQKYGVHNHCLTSDGEWAYLYGGVNGQIGLIRARLDTGMHVKFDGDVPRAQIPDAVKMETVGLAVVGETLIAAFPGWHPKPWYQKERDPKLDTEPQHNGLVLFNKRTGQVHKLLTLPGDAGKGQPQLGAIAGRNAGEVYAILGDKVVVVALADGAVRDFATKRVDSPQALAVDARGNLYLGNAGALQNVSVFSPAGKYLRSIGKAGGRPILGTWDGARGVYNPMGLAVDGQGRLWVAEQDHNPKRISVWETQSGKLVTEFFGGSHYSTYASMDPADPTRVYCHGVQWQVDLDKGTWRPEATVLREEAQCPRHPVTLPNGRQYAYLRGREQSGLLLRQGDRFVFVAGMLTVESLKERPWFADWKPAWDAPAAVKARKAQFAYQGSPAQLFWTDVNGNLQVEPEELFPNALGNFYWGATIDAKLNLYGGTEYGSVLAFRLHPTKIHPNGVPVYDLSKLERYGPGAAVGSPQVSTVAGYADEDAVYMLGGIQIGKDGKQVYPGFNKFAGTGEHLWGYWNCWTGMHWALRKPIPKKGELFGCQLICGKGGEFLAVQNYFGTVDLLTTDGLYVDKILNDQRLGIMGHETIFAEFFSGEFLKTKDGRYLLLAGDTDGRVNEVLGLQALQRFDGTYTLTPEDVKVAQQAREAYAVQQAKAQTLTIHRLAGIDWATASTVTREVDETRKFSAGVAYNEKFLVVRYAVTAPNELTNSITERQLLFKGGNCLDIELQTDPAAKPDRKDAGVGDVRLLITRQGGQPVCMAYVKKIPGFTGAPVELASPTGKELFDRVTEISVAMLYEKTKSGFTVMVHIPREALRLPLIPATTIRLDLGYRFGNTTGNAVAQRAYVWNNSPLTAIIYDVPSETRMEPAQWGTATVE